ncbi:hypothetical protein STXM2123_3560 [Streptomyces sp. F-3]|nr:MULTISPECIES: peptidoglycan recognition protein [unclassified Streptomyces]MDN5381614.1 peptidoglycan recognition protein [Streptomyces sp. LB8]GAT82858.1 hypothetical protein STXM2123_3560 [Streptomyces sp. F-3]
MRRYGFLVSSIGVACAVALAPAQGPPAAVVTARPASATGPSAVPGSTRSLPLHPLTRARTRSAAVAEQGLRRTDVPRFFLVGVVWDDPDAELHGSVRIRTRSAATGTWSDWQDLDPRHHADHGADPGTAERATGAVRGATAPLWVGESDGVEVRVRADTGAPGKDAAAGPPAALPSGLRLELVDPGDTPLPQDSRAGASHPGGPNGKAAAAFGGLAADARLVPPGATWTPSGREDARHEPLARPGGEAAERRGAGPYTGPRPPIVTRRGWGADESLRNGGFVYSATVKAVFVHHTSSGNNYSCAQAPSLIRSIYRYHVQSMGWRDIGYNFLVDKCGTIYEGRAGGVARAVLGAHTAGFNTNSAGIAVLGTHDTSEPPPAAVTAVAQLAAWKLGLHGVNPSGKTYLTSGGGNLYQKGKSVRLDVISGHRDGFSTDCPGRRLYDKLGAIRSAAARYQGR